MSIDGRFLTKLAYELQENLNTGRIQKISQLGKTDFLFFVRANNKNHKLYISLSTSLSRINLTTTNYPSDYLPGGFCMFLRKHIEGGVIQGISTLNDDRILCMDVDGTNEIGDKVRLKLLVEMFSRYTNLIVTDDKDIIINAFNHISPFDNSDRTIVNGVKYELPEDSKILPQDSAKIREFLSVERSAKDLIEYIRGFSPLLASYFLKEAKYSPQLAYATYEKMMSMPINPTMTLSEKPDFYYFDLFEKNKIYFNTLSELLDHYFQEASAIERVKQIHKYLNTFAKQELKRKKNKMEKLTTDMHNALDSDIWRIKGDVIISNQHQIKRGDASHSGYSYELDKDVEIELDRLLNPIQNANKYYIKYKKQKTAVAFIDKQMSITKDQIVYLDEIVNQINSTHSLSDLVEIQDELSSNGFLPRKKAEAKKNKPNFDTYIDELGISILVGKNNIQNNYLTHKFAKKDWWWFHVKNQTGSHVIVCTTDELKESTIRRAANFSAYYSKSRLSGSVPVDYTRIKNIKKVPGILGSFVTYTDQKTIYIDPDPEIINDSKIKKA